VADPGGWDYPSGMKDLVMTLPREALASAKIPPAELERELRVRLAAALFSDGILGGAAACRVADMSKAEFQKWLGDHGVAQPLDVEDYVAERENLGSWLKRD
jgi:predicted HTH domain antitoxin